MKNLLIEKAIQLLEKNNYLVISEEQFQEYTPYLIIVLILSLLGLYFTINRIGQMIKPMLKKN